MQEFQAKISSLLMIVATSQKPKREVPVIPRIDKNVPIICQNDNWDIQSPKLTAIPKLDNRNKINDSTSHLYTEANMSIYLPTKLLSQIGSDGLATRPDTPGKLKCHSRSC